MKDVAALRVVTFLEGISFLVLLFVAMPLKYLLDLPLAVRVAGGLHGLLFLGLALSLYHAHVDYGWSRSRLLVLLGLSLVPGSFFWMDERIVAWSRQSAREEA